MFHSPYHIQHIRANKVSKPCHQYFFAKGHKSPTKMFFQRYRNPSNDTCKEECDKKHAAHLRSIKELEEHKKNLSQRVVTLEKSLKDAKKSHQEELDLMAKAHKENTYSQDQQITLQTTEIEDLSGRLQKEKLAIDQLKMSLQTQETNLKLFKIKSEKEKNEALKNLTNIRKLESKKTQERIRLEVDNLLKNQDRQLKSDYILLLQSDESLGRQLTQLIKKIPISTKLGARKTFEFTSTLFSKYELTLSQIPRQVRRSRSQLKENVVMFRVETMDTVETNFTKTKIVVDSLEIGTMNLTTFSDVVSFRIKLDTKYALKTPYGRYVVTDAEDGITVSFEANPGKSTTSVKITNLTTDFTLLKLEESSVRKNTKS